MLEFTFKKYLLKRNDNLSSSVFLRIYENVRKAATFFFDIICLVRNLLVFQHDEVVGLLVLSGLFVLDN